MTDLGVGAAEWMDERYAAWKDDPSSVSSEWQAFFRGFELGLVRSETCEPRGEEAEFQSRVERLIYRYRDIGHLMACLDPLSVCPTSHPLLDLEAFGLTNADLGRTVRAPVTLGGGGATLAQVVDRLRVVYTRSLGLEYQHLQSPEERGWLRERIEGSEGRVIGSATQRQEVLDDLLRATRFEEFLQKRYLGQTRFSLEGAEVLIPLLRGACRDAAEMGVERVVLGMAHRGRLNVHVHLLCKSYRELFCQFEASYDPEQVPGGGDVKYHSGYSGDLAVGGGKSVTVLMPENPSHLEAINPVVEGIARAFQDRIGETGASKVLPLLIHGDSAFPGQGIVAETLNCARLEGYRTGGTLHLVLNNQIGYTTLPGDARSTRYATDLAKMLMVPIFHVYGENPEMVLRATRWALEYRMNFGKDVVVDLVCYRRHGHNEGDEPYFTQPLMYQRIAERPPVYRLYAKQLEEAGEWPGPKTLNELEEAIDAELADAHREAHDTACVWTPAERWSGWEQIGSRYTSEDVETGCSAESLAVWAEQLYQIPEGFRLHEKLERIFSRRKQLLAEQKVVDWAGAEGLAFASLVGSGVTVRLSGEDSRRGTFSHRHSVWFDTETGEEYCPLRRIAAGGAVFHAYDSPLSEAAVMGFEYGYAAVNPQTLVLWEAQYGDFANGAQVIVDQFLASGEAKWQRPNGLVLLLPHGYEGQGPDHSTARPERFLQLCAENNLQVSQPTTPAQYFHLLRRQVMRPFRKPLVVLTPKSLLRHPEVISPLNELVGGAFQEVLPDPELSDGRARRILLCSGKIYYELLKRRRELAREDVAVLRLEQFYPWPEISLSRLRAQFEEPVEWYWVQEEPQNMGGWNFVAPRLQQMLGYLPRYVGRADAASPATGFPFIHREEQADLIGEALKE